MKVESVTGKVHKASEFFDSRFINDFVRTECGKEFMLRSYIEEGCVKKTSRPITCKNCKRS